MRDLDDLVNAVRNPDSRDHLAEAVRAYGAGAYRAAVISTWVTVALDIVSKLRELADAQDAEAKKFLTALDAAIATGDVRKLNEVEGNLLNECRVTFEMISTREHEELSRLQSDRHVCAHPAFVEPDRVFRPTPELVRSHIATAVEAVLEKGPTPGRKTLDAFLAESLGYAWPRDITDLTNHLRARYVHNSRASLRRNLALVVVKGCVLGVPDVPTDKEEMLRQRLSQTAQVLEQIDHAELTSALQQVVRVRAETPGLTDEQLLRSIGTLGNLASFWTALPDTTQPSVVALVHNAPLEDLQTAGALRGDVADPAVDAAVKDRVASIPVEDITTTIQRSPSTVLVQPAIAALADSASWRTGERRMADIVRLAEFIDLDALHQVLEILRTNSQVREAADVPGLVNALFDATSHLPGAFAAWKQASEDLQSRQADPNDWYAYPGLAVRVTESGK